MESNERLGKLYGIERDKLTQLPDADADFKALERAYERFEQEARDLDSSCGE